MLKSHRVTQEVESSVPLPLLVWAARRSWSPISSGWSVGPEITHKGCS